LPRAGALYKEPFVYYSSAVILDIFQKILRVIKAGIAGFFGPDGRVVWWKVVIVLGVLIAGGIGIKMALGPNESVSPQVSIRQVDVRSVGVLASEKSPLSVVGTVSSKSEATVRAESSGAVTSVYRALGDSVGVGTIVATLENSSERAALLQAEGAEQAAQASLDKVKSGARSEERATLSAALQAAESGVVNAILSAYTGVDAAIPGTVDDFFTNATYILPHFNVLVPDDQLRVDVENERLALGPILERERARALTLSVSDDLPAELAKTTAEVRRVRDFLDAVIKLLNTGIPTVTYSQATIATYVTSASAARVTINTALSSLSSTKLSLETAQNNLTQSVTGARPEDLAAAEAALKQAEGSVAAARANLEHTIIRAPISGTINSFSLKKGDYVSLSAPVLTVANNEALEVLAYITESDRREIAVGQRVTFDSGATGVVTKIAPALDPLTKKIEVRIGVTDPDKRLVNGQSVLASIERTVSDISSVSRITIPISAIKVEADRTTVFTVTPDSTLIAHGVELGKLLGDRVEIAAGLTLDMEVVVDARGLREGQTVEVK